MKTLFAGLAAVALLASASNVAAQEGATVIHKETMGDHSKTVVHHANGSKTVIKRHGSHMKKVHTNAMGDKTVVEKSVDR